MGNPLDYYNDFTYHWEGRELRTALSSDGLIVFMYNEDGTRFLKNHDGFQTDYYYDGTRLIAEKNQNETIIYIYDDYGSVIGMQYRLTTYAEDVWDVYWFERNLQGDVVAVYNTVGEKLISYTYDAWGNFTTTYYNNGASTTAIKNPFRYRGYYYDQDLGLYFVGVRYYDPVTGRWINPDSALYHSMLGYNMFVYCNNNPVNFCDPTGQNAEVLKNVWQLLGALPLVDGPLPVGDIALIALATISTIVAVVDAIEWVSQNISDEDADAPKSITEPEGEREVDEDGHPVVKPGEQPTEEDGYIPPKGGAVKGKTKDGQVGWKDKNGNIWVPAPTGTKSGHGGGHWDVNSPKGGYTNVYPGGNTRGGQKPYPRIPIFRR